MGVTLFIKTFWLAFLLWLFREFLRLATHFFNSLLNNSSLVCRYAVSLTFVGLAGFNRKRIRKKERKKERKKKESTNSAFFIVTTGGPEMCGQTVRQTDTGGKL